MLNVFILFFKITIVSGQFCTDRSHLEDIIQIGKLSKANLLFEAGQTGIIECMRTCLQYSLCTSINLINNKCVLLTGENKLQDTYPGAFTSMKNDWPAERIVGHCFSKKCAENSKCVLNSKDEAVCEIVGCTDVPTIVTNAKFLNVDNFNSKPLWNIKDSIDKPCVNARASTSEVSCQRNGQWSDFHCILPVDCREAHSWHIDLGLNIDLDVDGVNGTLPTISVKCQKMEESDEYQVTVGHETGMLHAHGHERAYSQEILVIYNANIEAIIALIERSKSCKQIITINCYHMIISTKFAWINRRNTLSYYFVGDDVDYKGCACGLNNSCVKKDDKCNCDINDGVLREDQGEITNKNDLPILGVKAGDTGSRKEYGKIFIGPLICVM